MIVNYRRRIIVCEIGLSQGMTVACDGVAGRGGTFLGKVDLGIQKGSAKNSNIPYITFMAKL